MREAIKKHEDFQYWLANMDDALERFADGLPAEVRNQLSFSPDSLDVVESWILERYASTQEMLAPSESRAADGLARYIGETFRRALGGRWEIRLDDPKYAFHGIPQLTGFWDKPTPVCPLSLAAASADRRTGRFLSGVLASYLRDKQRKEGTA
jgi:hypothetical protein